MNIRTILLALMAALAITFAACGDDDDDATSTATTSAAVATSAASIATDEPAEATFFDCTATHTPTAPDASDFPVTVTDSSGNTVTIAEPPEKIASLDAAHTEVLYAIGAGDQVSAVDNFSDCPTAATSLPKLDSFTVSLEAITAQDPDLVIIFYDPGDLVTSLQAAGIPVILQETPPNLAGVYADIELIGKATGHPDEAHLLATTVGDEVDAIEASIEGEEAPTVFHELDATYFTVGDGSFIDDMYTLLGANNLGHDAGSSGPQLSSEAIIAANPDVIVLADAEFGESPDTVAARPGWSEIAAVQNDRVVGVDANITSRPGPRIVDALRLLRDALYPDS